MRTRSKPRAGFTLIELLVVVMIIAILAAVGIPKYQKTVETAKAQDAATTLALVANANRMYAVDNNGQLVECIPIDNTCPLVTGNYLAAIDWVSKPWIFEACKGVTSSGGCCVASGYLPAACAGRRVGPSPGTSTSPYFNWGYQYNTDGTIIVRNGAPKPN